MSYEQAIQESAAMQQLEDDFRRLIAVDESRATAAADVLEDAVLHITGMEGAPELRRILLAVVGLDDVLASGELGPMEVGELREVQRNLQGLLDGVAGEVVSADDHHAYAEAIYLIETIYGYVRCDVYVHLQQIHVEMLAVEAAAAAAAAASEVRSLAAPAPVQKTPGELRQEAIAARLRRFGGQ
jgi:hypothetical protein